MHRLLLLSASMLLTNALFAQVRMNTNNTLNTLDVNLLSQYVTSKGANIISFDASNIKQYWVDKTVKCESDHFNISLNLDQSSRAESIPYRIQLINVNESQNCRIEVISDSQDLEFVVLVSFFLHAVILNADRPKTDRVNNNFFFI